jgi:hypothetical protein
MSGTAPVRGRRPPGTSAVVLALLLAAAASAFWFVVPTETSESSGFSCEPGLVDPTGCPTEETRPATTEHTTLLDEQPEAIIPVAAIAIGLAGFPLLLNGTRLRRPARVVAATVLVVGSLLAGFSVGLAYLPSAAAMTVAAARG